MITRSLPYFALLLSTSLLSLADPQTLTSPNGRIAVRVDLSASIYYSVTFGTVPLLKPCPLSMELGDGTVLGSNPILKEVHRRQERGTFTLPIGRRKVVGDEYNELDLTFQGDFSVVFRAYNDGVAYRFRTSRGGDLIVRSEELQWNLAAPCHLWCTDYNTMAGSFEAIYSRKSFADWKAGSYAYSPVLAEHPAGPRMLFCDADLSDYPGLYIQKAAYTNHFVLDGIFPKYPKSTHDGGLDHFDNVVTETEDYIAKTNGTRDFPWRVTVIAGSDRELLDSDLVTKLARPSQIADTSWIRPGQAAWEWWNDWNLAGESFRTGINTATYRRYIEFAAENRLPYLVVDEGWSSPYDMGLANPDLDMPATLAYAREKGVKLVLWCTWDTLVKEWDSAFERFSAWGVAGIKVDFLDRDDQVAVASVERIAKEAASRHLFVDFHGCHAFPGFSRTYPNVLGFEGVRGNEYNKFSKEPPYPEYNVALAFTRGMMGPMDYTPGAMRTVLPGDFVPSNSNPGPIGTRCHQVAMYVVYDAWLPMLCDSPSAYRKVPDLLAFMSSIPSTWDETRGLESRTGDHVVVARRSGEKWYVGAMAGAEKRTLALDLGFLTPGTYRGTLVSDGVNADRLPGDYRIQTLSIDPSKPLDVALAPGGGAVLLIEKQAR